MALSEDGERWFLVNASPDLRAQIEATSELHPRGEGRRQTPLAGVLLTNADLDHVLGLFLLRENRELHLCATDATRLCVTEGLGLDAVVGAYSEVVWHSPPLGAAAERLRIGSSELRFRAIPLPASAPRYAGSGGDGDSVAYEISGEAGTLVIAPDVGALTAELRDAIGRAEAVLFDGTFWSREELREIDPRARSAEEMGHLPIRESLPVMAELGARVKAYIHINNTNPMLDPRSAEHAQMREAGVAIATDGMEFSV